MRRLAAAFALVACSAPITVEHGDVHQVSWGGRVETHLPALVVVALDDMNDAAGATMRATITPDAIAPSFDALLQRYPSDSTPSDPASGVVQDVRVIVVHPSSGTFVTPLDDPALAISAVSVGPTEVNALAAAVASHAQEGVAPTGASYPLLEETRDVVALVARERAPRDDHEAALLASFPPHWATTNVALVTAHDDASPGDASTFSPPAREGGGEVFYVVTEPCDTKLQRIDAWRGAILSEDVFSESVSTCGPDPAPIPLVEIGTDDIGCFGPVGGSPIARSASGAECVVTFYSPSVTSCDPARGWADPVGDDGTRKPFLLDDEGVTERRCEVLQLEGAARTSCETTLACSGCGPGVCFPPALQANPDCPPFVRFVEGAMPPNATLHFTCNLSP